MSLPVPLITIALLTASNVFMTFAWYGHLKFKTAPLLIVIAVSWLIAFDVINARNPQADKLLRLLDRATEPVYKPLRKFIPPIGGIDITPIIVIFGIVLLENLIVRALIF